MNMGKLICIEAGDGSGKETQTKRLFERLQREGCKVRHIAFPNYDSESSALIKMYLRGDFGKRPDDVSPYIASTFYAVDRYASYKKEWEAFYREGGIILADRYTTSNMVHQAVKITDPDERETFLDWLRRFEFDLFGLPQPDCVLFLDMPPAFAAQLMVNRGNKITGSKEKDIHERDTEYLKQAYYCAVWLAEKFGWQKVSCVRNEQIRSIEDIHNEVFDLVRRYL
ncbi:MAG: dTMP kinase [Caldicoprobacterales bacterium]|jgi:dTMP kinase|nr:thymidylate kinase [Clostridiales bacterium]